MGDFGTLICSLASGFMVLDVPVVFMFIIVIGYSVVSRLMGVGEFYQEDKEQRFVKAIEIPYFLDLFFALIGDLG